MLLSGGIDSTAILKFYLLKDVEVQCIHFQYNQPNAQSEEKAVNNITKYYKVKRKIITLDFPMHQQGDELLFRNVLFVLAAGSLGIFPARIALGIHRGTTFYDCSRSFIVDCQRILDGYYAGTVRLEALFADFTKSDIIKFCKKYKVPLDLTYSCQRQNHPPCEECPSCIDRRFVYEC